jgi:hypothetical protein
LLENPLPDPYVFEDVVGPGLGNIVTVDGGHWLVFHGCWPGAATAGADERFTWKLPLSIGIAPGRSMSNWIVPGLPPTKPPETSAR